LLEDVIMIEEDEIKYTIKWAYYNLGLILEGAGAISLSVLIFEKLKIQGNGMFILSGSNIDESVLDYIIKD
ncbi:MAG: threonine ammonia-lyase, partial [Candidatus Hydrothermia bacterium]